MYAHVFKNVRLNVLIPIRQHYSIVHNHSTQMSPQSNTQLCFRLVNVKMALNFVHI